jgi:antitoxin ParD1/3/4
MDKRSGSKSKTSTVSLPAEQSRYIDHLIASGGYASASEVISAGLHALQERDASLDRWLSQEVVPVYDAMVADPARGLSGETLAGQIEAHHTARLDKRRRGG